MNPSDDDDDDDPMSIDEDDDDDDDDDGIGSESPPPPPRRRREREEDEEEEPAVTRADVRQSAAAAREDGDGTPSDVHQFYVDEEDFLDGYEDEEHEAGAVLPNVILADANLYYRELLRVVVGAANENTALLEKVLHQGHVLTAEELHRLNVRIKYWTVYLVENYYQVLGHIVLTPTGQGGESEQSSGSIFILPEIWRMKLLVNHARLPDLQAWKLSDSEFLREWFLDAPGVPLDRPPKHPTLAKAKNGEVRPEDQRKYDHELEVYAENVRQFEATKRISDTPLLMMNQRKVMRLVQYMTSKIRVLPYHADMVKLLEMLELKTAMFFCQTMPGGVLNDPQFRSDMHDEIDKMRKRMEEGAKDSMQSRDASLWEMWEQQRPKDTEFTASRDFWFFCAIYFVPLKRALYWAENFQRLRLPRPMDKFLPEGACGRLKDWIAMLAKQQGDKFHDRLEVAARDGLVHPSDLDWLSYRFPSDGVDPVTVLRKTRGVAEFDDYHEQMQFSWQTVLNQVNVNPMSNLYVLHLFDRYLNAYKQTQFIDGYVIMNPDIDEEDVQTKWQHSREPFLINVCGGFWLLMDGKVLEIYDIYESLCMWMVTIHLTRDRVHLPKDCLADRTYIGDIIDRIVMNKKDDYHVRDKHAHMQYTTGLERGIPQGKTRMYI